jgi:hypothetical protein
MFDSFASARVALAASARNFDAASLTHDDALRAVEELGAIRRLTEGMLAKAAKRVADATAPAEGGARAGTALVARSLGTGVGEVRAAIATATRLQGLPATDDAVRAGTLSSTQAHMIAEAASANPDSEHELLAAAKRGLVPLKDACIAARARAEDPDQRRKRQQGERGLRMWTDTDGMVAGRFRLTPEVGGQVKAAIDAQVQRIFRKRRAGLDHEPHEAYAADALAGFVLGTDEVPKGVSATVHVVIDHGALMRGGAVDGEVCEIPGVGPVDVAWVRELLGSAFLTAVIKRGKDILTVAHLGRHVPAEVRTALEVSGHECDVEGCFNRGYLERDHTHDHAKGGPTAFWNLGWLCYPHHRLKSAGWLLGPADPVTRKRILRPPPQRVA